MTAARRLRRRVLACILWPLRANHRADVVAEAELIRVRGFAW